MTQSKQERGNILWRFSQKFQFAADKIIPDSMVFCLILTFIVFFAALIGTGTNPVDLCVYWFDGMWTQLSFAMQMSLMVVICAATANSKYVLHAVNRLASYIRSPGVAMCVLMIWGYFASFINWAFCTMSCTVFAIALAKLKPAFKKDGTVTAGNASGMNDGASAVILMTADKAQSLGVAPMARIVSMSSAGLDPSVMGLGPVPATRKALKKAGLTLEDLDLIELNEAFAAQSLGCLKELGLDMGSEGYAKVNVNGGAIAHGHALANSGTRILTTLLYELKRRGGRYGLATLCIGGGQGMACIVENLQNR